MRYLLALACLVACGGDSRYRTADGEIANFPWRCKEGTYTGSYLTSRGMKLAACPGTISITCPDPAGGTREVFVVAAEVSPDDPPFTVAGFCARVHKAGI